MAQSSSQQHCLEEVVDSLIELGKEEETVSVGDIQARIGARGYGPFLFVPAIIEISPVGGIPGLPTLLALIVAIFAVQMLMGKERFWMPAFLKRRSVGSDKLEKGLNKMRPVLRWLDKLFRPRLEWATRPSFVRLIAVLCLLMTLTVPPLELVPFASTAPFAAIVLFGLGLATKDGVLILLGMGTSLVAVIVGVSSLMGGG